ncbi:hypothetical protein [Sphingomonas sp. YL-JM2C]
MGAKRKIGILAIAGDTLSGLWGVYSSVTAVTELPNQANAVAAFFADPPLFLPWIMLAALVVLTAWAFWPSDEDKTERFTPATASNVVTVTENSGSIHIGDNYNQDSSASDRLASAIEKQNAIAERERMMLRLEVLAKRLRLKPRDNLPE